MIKAAFTAAILMIATPALAVSADGFRFKKTDAAPKTMIVLKMVTHTSNNDLLNSMPADKRQVMRSESRELHAWSILKGNVCEVHVIDPKVSYQPEYIGHEITHCMYGEFHD